MKHRFWIALMLVLALTLTAFAEGALIIEDAVEPVMETVDGVPIGDIELETADGLPMLGATGEQLSVDVAPQTETNDVEMNAVPTELCLGVGETYRLRSEGSTFKSSKKSVARVNDAGLVTAVKVGKARITIRKGGKTVGECLVTVRKAPNKVTLSKTRLVFPEGRPARKDCLQCDDLEEQQPGCRDRGCERRDQGQRDGQGEDHREDIQREEGRLHRQRGKEALSLRGQQWRDHRLLWRRRAG